MLTIEELTAWRCRGPAATGGAVHARRRAARPARAGRARAGAGGDARRIRRRGGGPADRSRAPAGRVALAGGGELRRGSALRLPGPAATDAVRAGPLVVVRGSAAGGAGPARRGGHAVPPDARRGAG